MFKNKNIIITGASAGLGKALAYSFAELGANICLAARRVELLHALKKDIQERYPAIQILIFKTDVKNQLSCERLLKEAVKQMGILDIFIANAGQSMWSRFRDIADPKEMQELMQLNYMGVVFNAFYALPYLRQSHGSFVVISSIQGVLPVPFHSGYVASKYAVNGFIDTLRLEEPDIHFLLALPSWIAGTELRAHALTGAAQESVIVNKHHSKKIMSAESCAQNIIRALKDRHDQVYIPKKYQYVSLLRQFFTKFIDRRIFARVKKQLRAE
jgi:short-subunit dehydrogenase